MSPEPVGDYLLLVLEGPLQAWGDVTRDTRRPTRRVPTRSGLAGLMASALGWRYADGAQTTALAESLGFAVGLERAPEDDLLTDYQTVKLSKRDMGWTREGLEGRESDFADATAILHRQYLVDTCFRTAIGLASSAPVPLDEVAAALRTPARPLYLGRKSCPPAGPLLAGRIQSATALDALRRGLKARSRCWYTVGEGPADAGTVDVSQRRDFATDRWLGYELMQTAWLEPGEADS
jgi:CRISPR system Cascade subunit CasD